MARLWFGGTTADYLFSTVASANRQMVALATGTVTVTFWDSATGGTQYIDLLDASGSPITQLVVTGAELPRFQGPDGIAQMWADAGDGRVVIVSPDGATNAAASASAAAASAASVSREQPGGVAGLDGSGLLYASRVPDSAIQGLINNAASATRAALANLISINLTDYGPIGATDDAATVNAAIAAANALSSKAGGLGSQGVNILVPGKVNLPNGTTQRITSDAIFFTSTAPGRAVIVVGSGVAFTWGTGSVAAGIIKSGGTRGIKFAAGALGVDSTQICHLVDYASELSFNDTKVANPRVFVQAGTSSTTPAYSVMINGLVGSFANIGTCAAIDVRYGAGLTLDGVNVFNYNVGFPGNATETHASVGTTGTFSNGSGCGAAVGRDFIDVVTGSWDTITLGSKMIAQRFDTAFKIAAAAGVTISNIWMSNPIFDYNANGAISITGSGGNVTKMTVYGGWFVATDGIGVHINGTGGLVESFKFHGSWALLCGQNNWRVDSGSARNVSLIDCAGIGANRLAATNTTDQQDGTVLNGSDWQIIGGQHGLDGSSYVPYACQARFGLTVGTSSDRYKVVGATLDGVSAPSANLSAHTAGGSNGLARKVTAVTTKTGLRLNATTTAAYTIAASGTAMTNYLGMIAVMYVSGGTVTGISVNGVATGLTSGAITLGPGDTWTLTYSAAPTVNRQLIC